jgi:co-chaperonin GroES (HSP10)
MRIQPTSDYILIKQVEAPKKETTIILTTDPETGMKPAKILAVGKDVKDLVENTMVYPVWSEAKPVTIDGVELALLKEKDVLAFVSEL